MDIALICDTKLRIIVNGISLNSLPGEIGKGYVTAFLCFRSCFAG